MKRLLCGDALTAKPCAEPGKMCIAAIILVTCTWVRQQIRANNKLALNCGHVTAPSTHHEWINIHGSVAVLGCRSEILGRTHPDCRVVPNDLFPDERLNRCLPKC